MANDLTKEMLKTIREGVEANKHYTAKPIEDEKIEPKSTFLSEARYLMDEAVKKKINEGEVKSNEVKFEIDKNTPQFGDVYTKQLEQLKKTIEEDLKIKIFYYIDKSTEEEKNDLILNGKISSLNIIFQFRYKDPSGDGCYIWANETQLSDVNTRKLGKIRDAFVNWKTNLIQDGDLLEKLHKASTKN